MARWVLPVFVGPSSADTPAPARDVKPTEKQPASEPEPEPETEPEPEPEQEPEPEPSTKACGARAGNTCADDEYCAYEPGQICGWADATATCKKKPEACTLQIDTVCGCDGKNYANACAAAVAGTGVMAKRECNADGS